MDLMWVMLDHPRSAIVGISSVLKFGLDPIYTQFDVGVGSRKKVRTGQDSQKSHKVITFRLFGEKPPLHRLKPKFAWWVISPT